MLKIHYGECESEDYIFNPDSFFNNTYEDEWITEPLSVQMIKDIDGSEVIGARVIDSPYLGSISTERLSGGVKTLILMSKDRYKKNKLNEYYRSGIALQRILLTMPKLIQP